MEDNNGTSLYEIYLDSNFTDYEYFDLDRDACFNMDCIFERARKNRLPVLRSLTLMLALVGLAGIVGNIFVILVFSRTRQKWTSTYLVLMLGIIDLIACSIVIPSTLLKEWLFEFKSDIVCKLAELLRNSAIISSAMILAAIAFDRFLLVYRKNSSDGNKHVTMAMILVTVVTGIALGVPPMLGVGVYMDYINGGVINIKVCLTNERLISEKGLQIYWQIITTLFSLLIVTIIVLYMLIFIMVYRHTNRIKANNKRGSRSTVSTLDTKQPFQMTSVLPFAGLSKTRNSLSLKQTKKKPEFLVTWKPREKLRKLFKNKVTGMPTENNVVSIKIIPQSSTPESSSIDIINVQPIEGGNQAELLNPAGLRPDNIYQSFLSKQSPSPTLTPVAKPNPHQGRLQHEVLLRNRSAHIKTTKVLCIITTVYIIAFLPMFLITHRVIEQNEIAFYLYFINNAANPIIYSFMNRKFRQDIWKMFSCQNSQVWQG